MKTRSIVGLCLATLACWTTLAHGQQNDKDATPTARLPEGVIAYVEQRAKPTRSGLADFLDLPAQRFTGETNIYEKYAFNIFVIKPDGTGKRQLTTDGMNHRPKWSRDGQWIAYLNGPPQLQNLYVVKPDGTERKQLLQNEVSVTEFWWSLDSDRILAAVETRREANSLEGRVVDIKTGKTSRMSNSDWMRGWNHWEPNKEDVVNPRPRLLQALSNVAWPRWSPDAQFVAFIRDGMLHLAHVQSVSDSGRWFAFNTEPPADELDDWSWDGRKMLFKISNRPAVVEIKEGKWANVYAVTSRRVRDTSFNSDGTRVAFTAIEPGKTNTDIYIADSTGENEIQVTDSIVDHLDIDWQPVLNPPKEISDAARD